MSMHPNKGTSDQGTPNEGASAGAQDSRAQMLKGKLPRNVVLTFGGIAAVAVGTLGYYFQSLAERQLDEKAEYQRAERLRQGTAGMTGPGNARTLEQTIRDQAEKARAEADRAEATRRETVPMGPTGAERATVARPPARGGVPPWLSSERSGVPSRAASSPLDPEQTALAEIATAPAFKPGGRRSQLPRESMATGMAGMPTPAQVQDLQQAVALRAAAKATPASEGQPQAGEARFLAETAGTSTLRTSFDGRLPDCTLSRGFVIPAMFVGALNSDKPGEFRATVAQDVYDTVKGTCKVIPAGSTLVGVYSADIAIGQERILAAFVRMQLPNGKTVPLMGMQAADPNGQSGVSGDVDNHFWKIFGDALLVGLLEQRFHDADVGTTMGPSGVMTYGNAAGQIATQTASTLLSRNQGIRPTITTTPGQKLLVQVKHDMVLEAYRD